MESQAFVATTVVMMRAGEFFSCLAGEHGARHQFEDLPARAIAEAAFADVRHRATLMHLGERFLRRPRRTAVIDDRYRTFFQFSSGQHLEILRPGNRLSNRRISITN